MAAPQEVKPGGAGFGSRRFVVRGQRFLDLSVAAALRPAYDEYPELYPLIPEFPRAGRRGGSAAPRKVGEPAAGAAEGGAVSSPAGAGGAILYPGDRHRVVDLSVGSLPAPGSPDSTSANNCSGAGGVSVNRGVDVANGVTTVSVIGPISRPFVIRYAEIWGGGSDAARSNIGVRVASDRVTTGGFDTSGVPLGIDISGDVDCSGHGQMHRLYPNFRWTVTPAFIKFIVFNNSGAAQFYQLIASLEWLN